MISNPATPNPSQLMSKLRMMPDAELFKYAQMHQSDPYIFPLTFQESNARKAMRAAQQMAGVQSPKVVQQDLQQMAPPRPMQAAGLPMAAAGAMGAAQPEQALPEDQGIGQLPAPNMQGMAEGGIVGYAPGGQVDAKQAFAEKYHDAAVRAGEQLGVDPGIIISQWGLETGWGKSVIPGTNNLGNIKDFSGKGVSAYDKAEKSTSKYRKYDSPETFADDYVSLIKRKFPNAVGAGNDVNKFTTGLRPGEKGGYASDENYGTKIAKTFSKLLPISTATAADTTVGSQAPTQPDLDRQKQQAIANAPSYESSDAMGAGLGAAITSQATPTETTAQPKETPSFFDRSKEKIAGIGTAGLAALGNAATGAYEALTPSFAPGTTASQAIGRTAATASPLAALGLTGGALSAGAANALSNATPGQLDQLSADIGSDTGIAAAISNAPNRPPEKPPMSYGEQMTNVGKALVGHPDVYQGAGQRFKELLTPTPAPVAPPPAVSGYTDEATRLAKLHPALVEPEETPTAEAPAEAPKKGGMDYSDLMLKMGLGLMAGKSPNALTNVGEAGLGALQMTMAEKKAAAEQSYHEALAEQARAHAAYYPGMLAQKMAGLDAKQRVAVETETARLMASYKNNPLYMTNPAALQQMEMSVREGVMNRILGQSQAPTAGAPVTVPQGVTVKQIG